MRFHQRIHYAHTLDNLNATRAASNGARRLGFLVVSLRRVF